MKIAILAFAVAAVALPTVPAAKADQLTAKRQVAELLDAIPVNVGTSLKRPNGDVIGILKTRQEVESVDNINPEDLTSTKNPNPNHSTRQSIDPSYLERADYLHNTAQRITPEAATNDLALSKRDRKEFSDIPLSQASSFTNNALTDAPDAVGDMPLTKRSDRALNEMSAEELQGAAQGVVDEKPVTVGVPLDRRTRHELDELTVAEIMGASRQAAAEDPVVVGMPEEQAEALVPDVEM